MMWYDIACFMSWHRKCLIMQVIISALDNRRKVNNCENTVAKGIAL